MVFWYRRLQRYWAGEAGVPWREGSVQTPLRGSL